MKKIIAFIFFTALLFVQCDWYRNLPSVDYDKPGANSAKQNSSEYYPPNAKSGSCYAKCMIPDEYDIEEVELAIYTGNENEEDIEIEILEVELEPEITETYKIVADTTLTDNYEIQKIEIKKLVQKGGFTTWKTVLCPGDITLSVVGQIQDALRDRGYFEDDGGSTLDGATKEGLVTFQKDNGLPIGNLDMKTLKVLDINY